MCLKQIYEKVAFESLSYVIRIHHISVKVPEKSETADTQKPKIAAKDRKRGARKDPKDPGAGKPKIEA